MTVKGRKPQAETLTRRRSVHDWVEVLDEPFRGAPRLPRLRADGQPWPDHVRHRWRSWSTMPHCVLWQPSEWEFAIDTAEVAARFYETGMVSFATELRYRERILGTTADARRDQRIRYVVPTLATVLAVTPSDSFRDL